MTAKFWRNCRLWSLCFIELKWSIITNTSKIYSYFRNWALRHPVGTRLDCLAFECFCWPLRANAPFLHEVGTWRKLKMARKELRWFHFFYYYNIFLGGHHCTPLKGEGEGDFRWQDSFSKEVNSAYRMWDVLGHTAPALNSSFVDTAHSAPVIVHCTLHTVNCIRKIPHTGDIESLDRCGL